MGVPYSKSLLYDDEHQDTQQSPVLVVDDKRPYRPQKIMSPSTYISINLYISLSLYTLYIYVCICISLSLSLSLPLSLSISIFAPKPTEGYNSSHIHYSGYIRGNGLWGSYA